MSKEEMLRRLLDRSQKIAKQMSDLFIKNELAFLDLNKLPPGDRERWFKLHKRHYRLGDFMCYIILEK